MLALLNLLLRDEGSVLCGGGGDGGAGAGAGADGNLLLPNEPYLLIGGYGPTPSPQWS